jgi:hypothetical protein
MATIPLKGPCYNILSDSLVGRRILPFARRQRKVKDDDPIFPVSIFAYHLGLLFVTRLELELELIQPQMAQKPMLWGEVGATRLAPRAPYENSVKCASTGSSPEASQKLSTSVQLLIDFKLFL